MKSDSLISTILEKTPLELIFLNEIKEEFKKQKEETDMDIDSEEDEEDEEEEDVFEEGFWRKKFRLSCSRKLNESEGKF